MRNLFILLLVVFLSGCEKPRPQFHANDVAFAFTQADFNLTDHNGKARTLADFRGKVVVLFFGYTHCSDICTTTMADLAQVMKLLGGDAEKVQVLFITIDPEHDDPKKLAQYTTTFNPSFLGLYGDAKATEQASKAFFVGAEKHVTEKDYSIDHSVGELLVDPQGRVRLHAPVAQRSDWMVDDIRLLLEGN